MKAFIVSICLVVLIFTSTFVNSFFVKKFANELIEKATFLNEDYESFKNLESLWNKKSSFISLSSSTKETDKIEDMLSAIESLYKADDFSGLEEKKSLLINYIKLIFNHERVNIENII